MDPLIVLGLFGKMRFELHPNSFLVRRPQTVWLIGGSILGVEDFSWDYLRDFIENRFEAPSVLQRDLQRYYFVKVDLEECINALKLYLRYERAFQELYRSKHYSNQPRS